MLKHFPIRSQAHGERKILRERLPRFSGAERSVGWHAQYDGIDTCNFLRDPADLCRFDPLTFAEEYLVERVSGLRVFEAPPPWATPMRSSVDIC